VIDIVLDREQIGKKAGGRVVDLMGSSLHSPHMPHGFESNRTQDPRETFIESISKFSLFHKSLIVHGLRDGNFCEIGR